LVSLPEAYYHLKSGATCLNSAEDRYFELRGVSAETYAEVRLPAYFWEVLPQDKSARILDIGAGLGQWVRAMRDRGYLNATGIDINRNAVEVAASQGIPVTLAPDLGQFLEQHRRQFDFIIMNHVVEHLPKAMVIPMLEGVKNALTPETGKLYLATPNAQSESGCYWAYEDFTHEVLFTGGSLIYVMRAAGFKEITFVDPEGLAYFGPTKRLLRKLLYRWYSFFRKVVNWSSGASFHRPSPELYGWELRAVAR
jgi:SAM-dependent methyltransferase